MKVWLRITVLSFAFAVAVGLMGALAHAQVPEKAPVPPEQEIYHPPRTGFIPPRIDLSHLKAKEIPDELKGIQPPARWDWRERGAVTPVKNQDTCGSCYAFASIGNIESRLLIDGAGTYDFSENNAKECEWYESSCGGGNFHRLAGWFAGTGTVLEADDPYVPADVACNSTCPYVKTLLDWRVISGDDVPLADALKSYIHNYGPVYSTIFAGDTTPAHLAWMNEYQTYDGSYTLYYPGSGPGNHAILIVGWDDALPHAGGNGAWIVKNSWGTGWGGTCEYGTEGGYFTIAYGSASIGKWSSYIYDWQNYNSDGEVLHYDEGGGWVRHWGYSSTTGWGLCKFVPSEATYLMSVEFWTNDATPDIDVYIYDTFDGANLSVLRASMLDQSFSEPGYHSVPIPPIALNAGNDIFAVVKFTNDSYEYPIPADDIGPAETGKCYISPDGSNGSWEETSKGAEDVGIRIRTSKTLPAGPVVLSVTPLPNELDVPVTADIGVIFDTDIDPASVSPNTFIVGGSMSGTVPGTITCGVVGVTFDPDVNFKPGEVITVTLTTGIQSATGLPMADSYTWSFTALSGAGSGDFVLDSAYHVVDKPLSVIAADLDGDGDLDLATADGDSWGEPGSTVSVLLNNGDGTYAGASSYQTGSYPLSVYGADLDGDGDVDLVTTNYFDDNVSILLNNGNGTFAAHTDYAISTSPFFAVAADLDGDGDLDLTTANAEAPYVSVLMNDGSGTFAAPVNYTVNNYPIVVVAGDLDGDGDLDLATADYGPVYVPDSTVSVLLNNGNGTFAPFTSYVVGALPRYIVAADLDGDRDLDLATSNIQDDSVAVLLNNGNGVFAPRTAYGVGDLPISIFAADLDGDGDVDLTTTDTDSDSVSVLLNIGNGTFAGRLAYEAGDDPRCVFAGDLDGNGDLDLAVANRTPESVSILMNQAPRVIATSPTQNELDVPISTNISVTFDMDMDPATVNLDNFLVNGRSIGPYDGTIIYDAGSYTATFDPAGDFDDGELVTVTVTTDVQSAQGAPLGKSHIWSFTAGVANGYGYFTIDSSYQTGNGPISMCSGDFDADGDQDVAVANLLGDSISVFMNDGSGSFLPQVFYTTGSCPHDILTADLDDDGDLDLAMGNHVDMDVSILLNDGSGIFSLSGSTYPLTDRPRGMCGGDLDGDGDFDLAVVNDVSTDLAVLLNNGNGTFAPEVLYDIGYGALSVVAVDLDNDADLDLATNNVSVLLNNGDGTFLAHTYYPVGGGTWQISAGDLNGDGSVDLVTASYDTDEFSVLFNNGDGTFAAYVGYTAGDHPIGVVTADFDGDGTLDIACLNYYSEDITVHMNNGSGSFALQSTRAVEEQPQHMIASDFDNDGDIDLATVHHFALRMLILLNECDCIPGDADGNQSCNLLDATYIINYLYKNGSPPTPYALCSGDADCNCALNLLDATYMINYLYKNGSPPCTCTQWLGICGPLRCPN